MKFVAVTLLALIAAVSAAPVSVSDNNIGNIVTVGVNANLSLKNEINQDIINVIVALLNQQAIVVGTPGGGGGDDIVGGPTPTLPKLNITPEMIEKFKSLISKK